MDLDNKEHSQIEPRFNFNVCNIYIIYKRVPFTGHRFAGLEIRDVQQHQDRTSVYFEASI